MLKQNNAVTLYIDIAYIINQQTLHGLYSLYDDYVSSECKLGTLNALLYKTRKIWTNYKQFDLEIYNLRHKFYKLCYPRFIQDKCAKNFVEKK